MTIERLPPHSLDAEESVLGSLIIDGPAIDKVKHFLKAIHFYYAQNQYIYAACLGLRERREAIDQVTIAVELERKMQLESCGGTANLSRLISITPTSLDIEDYARIVRRMAVARELVKVGQQIAEVGYATPVDSNKALDDGVNLVRNCRSAHINLDNIVTPAQAADHVLDLIKVYNSPRHSISWGFKALDEATTGMYPNELIILGARPSVGKTQVMLDIADSVADAGHSALFCSAEMSMRQIMERKLSRELGISIWTLRKYGWPDKDDHKIMALAETVGGRKLHYMEEGIDSGAVYAEAQKLKESIGLDIVFIDYLGRLKDAYEGQKGDNRNVLVGKCCKALKSIAKDLNVPVVVACQLNRGVEHREDKVPTLADLRDSGEIEQDADVVFMLYRDVKTPDVLEMYRDKHRQLGAERCPVKLYWQKEGHRYADFSKEC